MDLFTLAALAIVAGAVSSIAKALSNTSGTRKRIEERSSAGK